MESVQGPEQRFRPGSQARRVALALLTGDPYTRQQLSDAAGGVSLPSVNRVVGMLEEAGARVERTLDRGGRQTVFRITGWGSPKDNPFPRLSASARIVAAEIAEQAVMVDFTTEDGARFRGRLRGDLASRVPLGEQALVVRLDLDEPQDMTVKLQPAEGEPLTVEHVRSEA